MGNSEAKAAYEAKLEDEIGLRRFTEAVLDSRQEELEAAEKDNARLARKLEALQKDLQGTQSLLAQTRQQLKAKSKELQEANDQISRLQHQRKDITESEAQEAYRKLGSNVQRWVESQLPPTLNDLQTGNLKLRPNPAQAARFTSLIREPARHLLNAWKSDEQHVIAIIMHYLLLVFFAKPFYCPLDDTDGDTTASWIDELENIMSKLPRDIDRCREWRCETLAALTSQKAFKAKRSSHLSLITDDLASLLSVLIPHVPITELQCSLRKAIINPAADFAHQLHLASNIFSLKWPAKSAESRLEVYECINLANNGEVLSLGNAGNSSQSQHKVSYLFDVMPGLFVERIEVGKKLARKTICRPKVLVYAGGGEAIPQSPTLTKSFWKASTHWSEEIITNLRDSILDLKTGTSAASLVDDPIPYTIPGSEMNHSL
ncbi:hypothetical protein PT974_09357 [Cladobotryum mycophilum]|uniref:Uncharacterized protein n=1 Tax=Cladobotryum mycophilum TaxID=491253 RepID=A0ABR0SH40_9HYPO